MAVVVVVVGPTRRAPHLGPRHVSTSAAVLVLLLVCLAVAHGMAVRGLALQQQQQQASPTYTRYPETDSYGGDLPGGTLTGVGSEGECAAKCSSWGPGCTGYVWAAAIPRSSPWYRYCWLKGGQVRPRALSAGGSTWTRQGLVVGVKVAAPPQPAARKRPPAAAPEEGSGVQVRTIGYVGDGSGGGGGGRGGTRGGSRGGGEEYVLCACSGPPCNVPVGGGQGVRMVGTDDCVNCSEGMPCPGGLLCREAEPSPGQEPSIAFAICVGGGGSGGGRGGSEGERSEEGGNPVKEALGVKYNDLAHTEEGISKVLTYLKNKTGLSAQAKQSVNTMSKMFKRVAALTDKASLACGYRCLACALEKWRSYDCIDDCAWNVAAYAKC